MANFSNVQRSIEDFFTKNGSGITKPNATVTDDTIWTLQDHEKFFETAVNCMEKFKEYFVKDKFGGIDPHRNKLNLIKYPNIYKYLSEDISEFGGYVHTYLFYATEVYPYLQTHPDHQEQNPQYITNALQYAPEMLKPKLIKKMQTIEDFLKRVEKSKALKPPQQPQQRPYKKTL